MSAIKELTLYSYYYSSASWRVRAFLALRSIPFKYEQIHLLNGAQRSEKFDEINPISQLPALKVVLDSGDTHILTQSLAIIDYLDENYPGQPIYPKDPILKAKSKAIADTISGGIQPLQNLETLTDYTEPLGKEPLNADDRKRVAQFWLDRKLTKLDKLVKNSAGKFCVGDELSIADICLVPQMFNARRFGLDDTKYPTLKSIDNNLVGMSIFKVSHPHSCPDTPESLRNTKKD